MDFSRIISSLLASIFMVFYRIFWLIISPYKTMRSISEEEDYMQIFIIFLLIGVYFVLANRFREYNYEPGILWILTFFHFFATLFFFYLSASFFQKKNTFTFNSFLFTFAYALIPTLIWFSINSVLYAVLPPPRTLSLLGKGFSVFYICFSIAVLAWKIILEYLAIRFSTKFSFYPILYAFLIFLVMIIPYSLFMYSLKFFRIPFL